MVGSSTYGNNNKIYSVDMMIAYINIFKPKSITIKTDSLRHHLDKKSWGNPIKKIYYSPAMVLSNKTKPKYKKEVDRIKGADLKYPIIMHGKHMVDGMHRLTKAIMTKKKSIKVYKFNTTIMNKFLVDKDRRYGKVDKMNVYEFIQLFHKKFKNGH
jgi:hypothetical protein